MSQRKPKMCVLSTTPLALHFFFKPHLRDLSSFFDITIVFNAGADGYLPQLDLPVKQEHVAIERKISLWRDLLALLSIFRLFRRECFDIVVSVVPKAGLLGMMAAFFAGISTRVHIFQGEVWGSKRGPMRSLLKFMDTLTARVATHVLAVSMSEKCFLEQQGVVPMDKAEVLEPGSICGVDTNRFRPDADVRAEVRGELCIPDDSVVCVFLGRLTVDKGVLDLAQAFALSATERPSLRLLIVGPDEEGMRERLRALVPAPLANRILIHGFTQSPERLLAASDFLCLPSYREGFGMVILEAAAVGIPAIGTRIYGITDSIQEYCTGKLVPVGDVHALSVAINQWVDDPQQRERFGNSACDRVRRKFEQRLVIDRYVQYFIQLHSSGTC